MAKPTTAQLREVAKRHVIEQGYQLVRAQEGAFGGTFYTLRSTGGTAFGDNIKVSIRTSRDRWISFQPKDAMDGTFEALEHADYVLVVAVNDHHNPEHADIYWISADKVRDAFKRSFLARLEADHAFKPGWGMWVGLDAYDDPAPSYVGSGLKDVTDYATTTNWMPSLSSSRPIPTPRIDANHARPTGSQPTPEATQRPPQARQSAPSGATVMDVIREAQSRVAAMMGLPETEVKLKLELQ